MSVHHRNTKSMVEFNKCKSITKLKAVEDAIQRLIENEQPVNFNSVMVEAGVSKSYLYNHPDHRRRIEKLREEHVKCIRTKPTTRIKSDTSKDSIIASLRKRVQELKKSVNELETENRVLREFFNAKMVEPK